METIVRTHAYQLISKVQNTLHEWRLGQTEIELMPSVSTFHFEPTEEKLEKSKKL